MQGGKRPGAGRPKGSKNKKTERIREHFEKFISDNLVQMQEDYDKLDPNQRLQFISLLTKYVLPSMKAVEMTGTVESPVIDMSKWK
ncbi:hypothetical protein [Maribacter sp. 2307UL18-2]|uniref:hypothetical protein n=1 Tax=Maribacter sp. 2307UL18-2 TaxID=3386274 RepID=UPI0039BD8A8A